MTVVLDGVTGADARAARADIVDLIVHERMARDDGDWARMASYYHPESSVEITWFRGTGAEFAASSSKAVDQQHAPNFHMMAPSRVTLDRDRALVETPCAMHSFAPLGGVDCSVENFVRLLWRVRRDEGRWSIAGLRCLYIRDLVHACVPARMPQLDETKLRSFRSSYRYIAYSLAGLGLAPQDDLPGTDRPEIVAALRAGEEEWLRGA